jgi:hypothetical protein
MRMHVVEQSSEFQEFCVSVLKSWASDSTLTSNFEFCSASGPTVDKSSTFSAVALRMSEWTVASRRFLQPKVPSSLHLVDLMDSLCYCEPFPRMWAEVERTWTTVRAIDLTLCLLSLFSFFCRQYRCLP